ncbi:D-alanyl-D-alanine carboxypeptidase family protein [Leptolyngbya cf. ectocarpi LEGE 11479]|uniref:non-specific serine/threonine protein kinase n=1 Tax=Leptolyngbya cf. ectocarpi LEGE 11479 TaxID=1828722 RepID=A0A929F8M9_LEPEC|nr:D-alanyl-D-alanine carboxypeptidase family protein [Leptolyngbya ectocarpi]MBE9068901.1 D-alanyl-D-alanine carboxypeptidase family protein [Leptolyngbya cf. ectocarpi LEGE 11479]
MKLANRFEVLDILDRGSYGITYRAIDHHQAHQPECTLQEFSYTHPKILKKFQQAASVLQKIGTHAQIPQLLACFNTDNKFYLAQEIIYGHNLSQEIRAGKSLDEGYVTKLLRDSLQVLAVVHQHHMVHRDIQPATLIRQANSGEIALVGFGIIQELSQSQLNSNGQIITKASVGTAGYIAPEQARGKPCYASDLYSVGMVAISALMDMSPQQLPLHPLTQKVQWSNETISPSLETFIKRLIEPKSNNRYPTATDALQALEKIIAGIRVGQDSAMPTHVAAKGRPPTDTYSATKKVTLIPPGKILKVMGAITAVLVMIGFGVKGYQWTARALSDRWDAVKTATTAKGYETAKSRDLVSLVDDDSIKARPELVEAFWEMAAVAKEEGVELLPLAAYISRADQRKSLPGDADVSVQQWLKQSDYHTGFAIAIGDKNADESTDWDPSFAQTDAYRWLRRYAKNYGFALSYPQGNPVGENEPWHWQYADGLE